MEIQYNIIERERESLGKGQKKKARATWQVDTNSHTVVHECERFLFMPGKRDGREIANQRIAAVAAPCCIIAIPPCEQYIYQAGSSLPESAHSLSLMAQSLLLCLHKLGKRNLQRAAYCVCVNIWCRSTERAVRRCVPGSHSESLLW